MVNPPEIYTGAQFTLRYGETHDRLTEYYEYTDGNGNQAFLPFGFEAAFSIANDNQLIDASSLPKFGQLMAMIAPRLEHRNWMKGLSAETPDRWIDLCCQLFSEIAEKYEDILTMQTSTDFDVTNPDKESRIIQYGHVIEGQVQDTPYGQLDATSDYVSGKTAEQHSGQDTIHERNELDAEILMDFRRKWDATINKIIEEFDVLFIRITGADFIA